jgi:TPP-dependent 2-oxoacid decarboxylase
MAPTISMGQYLFRRIQSIGVEHILGVPGDFNRKMRPLSLLPKNNDSLPYIFALNYAMGLD